MSAVSCITLRASASASSLHVLSVIKSVATDERRSLRNGGLRSVFHYVLLLRPAVKAAANLLHVRPGATTWGVSPPWASLEGVQLDRIASCMRRDMDNYM